MKKRKLTAVFVALSLLFVLTSFPAQAASQSNASVRIVDGLAFAGTVSNEEIASITPEERMVLEREISGTIVSTSSIPLLLSADSEATFIAPYALNDASGSTSYDWAYLRMTISRIQDYEASYGDRASFELVMTVTTKEGYAFKWAYPDYIGMSWHEDFILVSGTQQAYTYYSNSITGNSGFDYNCTTQDDICGQGVSFKVDLSADDHMVVLVAEVYASSSAGNDIWSSGVYVSCNKVYTINNVTFTVSYPPAFSFSIDTHEDDEELTVYAETTYV